MLRAGKVLPWNLSYRRGRSADESGRLSFGVVSGEFIRRLPCPHVQPPSRPRPLINRQRVPPGRPGRSMHTGPFDDGRRSILDSRGRIADAILTTDRPSERASERRGRYSTAPNRDTTRRRRL